MPTLAETRARVEADLDDATLSTIIDAETEALARHAGDTTASETHRALGLREFVLNRKPDTITAVKERRHVLEPEVTLAANDFRLLGNYTLLRLPDGTNPASFWGAEVVIEYAPEIDVNLRERVLLDLIQLSVEFRAFDTEEVGDWQGEQRDFEKRRNAILSQVREGRGLIA